MQQIRATNTSLIEENDTHFEVIMQYIIIHTMYNKTKFPLNHGIDWSYFFDDSVEVTRKECQLT